MKSIPDHSTFSKNRHGRFPESNLFEELFEQIRAAVCGSWIGVVEANAAKESRIPREQLAEAAQVKQTVRQYLVEVERQNPVQEPVHEQAHVSAARVRRNSPKFLQLLGDLHVVRVGAHLMPVASR